MNFGSYHYWRCLVAGGPGDGPLGLFQAAERLRAAGSLSTDELAQLDQATSWMCANLPRPAFVLSHPMRRVGDGGEVVWCRQSAEEFSRQLRVVADIVLDDANFRGGPYVPCGCWADEVTEVIYEDEFIVVAVEAEPGVAADRGLIGGS